MPPDVPAGDWDPTAPGGTGSSTGSAQHSLWDLSGLDENVPITIQRPGIHAPRLSPEDQAQVPQVKIGMPADLVKRPIALFGNDPQAYLSFQQALFAGGFYGDRSAKSIPWGSDPSGATLDAWKRVLTAAQQAQSAGIDITPDEVLARGATRPQGAASKAPMVVQTTDPALLSGLVQRAAQDALGRSLNKGEVDRFIASFHEQEKAYSAKRYQAEQDTSGQTFTLTQPDASAQAEQFVEQGHPAEAQGNQLADYFGVIQRMLGGG